LKFRNSNAREQEPLAMLPTDAAATKIQARARGMIDRKKVCIVF
jgi:hypothetical protein